MRSTEHAWERRHGGSAVGASKRRTMVVVGNEEGIVGKGESGRV